MDQSEISLLGPKTTSRNGETHNGGWLWDCRIHLQALQRLFDETSGKEGWPLEKAMHVSLVSPLTSKQFQKSSHYLLTQRISNIISCVFDLKNAEVSMWTSLIRDCFQCTRLHSWFLNYLLHFIVLPQTLVSPHKHLSRSCGDVRFKIGAIHVELESFVFLWIWFKFFSCDNGLNYHNQRYLFGKKKKREANKLKTFPLGVLIKAQSVRASATHSLCTKRDSMPAHWETSHA